MDRRLEPQPETIVWHKTADQIIDRLNKCLTKL
jgi:hypothetical protein